MAYTKKPRAPRRRPRAQRRPVARRRYPYRRRFRHMGVPTGLPTQRLARLVYVNNTEATSNLGVISVLKYRANSVFDPDQTGVGHQPFGFDTWATLYNHYVVLGAKITVKAINSIPDGASPAYIGCYLSDDTDISNYPNAYQLMEAGKGSYRLVNPGNNRPIAFGSRFSAKKFFNVTDVKDNARLAAAVTANPLEGAIFNVWYQTGNGSTATMYLSVRLEYIVSFGEPRDVNTS
ncbi:MAG: capsid protein [Circoviridae sp.]|nr:MAG: capsid protein [Circoviridae sp.]